MSKIMTQLTQISVDFKALAYGLPCGVILINSQGDIEWMNGCAKSWFGDKENVSYREVVQAFLVASPDEGDELILKSGQKLRLETSALPSQQGQVVLLSDLTHSRLIQDKLNQEKRLQLLGNMSASLAHQIRNPLTAALINLNTLTNQYPEEIKITKVIGNLKAIEQEINAILLFSKSDQTLVEKLCIEDIINEAISVSNIESKEIVMDVYLSLADKMVVIGNRQGLVGSFTNIIGNAIEASKSGGCVKIRAHAFNEHIEIVISDQGDGIHPNDLKHICDPFFTTKAKGTGLGLSIAKNVIENHQGQMIITSNQNQGTQVRIHLHKVDHVHTTD